MNRALVLEKRIKDLIGWIVDVKGSGAVLLGRNYTVDGHWDRLVRVITHAHSDHLKGLRDSIEHCSAVIATPATLELIYELVNLKSTYKSLLRRKSIPLEYDQWIEFNGEMIKLVRANHIIGSAQVLVETNGYRVGYTGDFKLEGTPVMRDLDVLVIESTYGSPEHRRPFKKEVEQLLVDTVIDGLESGGPVVIYGYYGKLQEVMKILRDNKIYDPFLMPPKIYRVTKIVEKYGGRIGEYYNMFSPEGRRLLRDTSRYILFLHMSRAGHRNLRKGLNIILSGWEFREPRRRIDSNTWLIAFSDHSDYDDLIGYVREAKPRLVVVENARGGSAYELARSIWVELGIPSIVLPNTRGEKYIYEYT